MQYVFRDDEIQLPAEIVDSVRTAKLPEAYEQAKHWLATCEADAIGEVADWADKMAALASLARMREDKELSNLATRIRGRCERKMGDILRTFDARGGDRSKSGTPPTFAQPSRMQAAKDAGLSRDQALTAVRISAIPEDEFEDKIESPDPPGTSILSKLVRLNRSSAENRVSTITASSLAEMSASHKAARIIENVLRLEGDADQCDLSKMLELLLDTDNVEKLPRIQRGLNFAARIKTALDKAGHGAKPFLKTVK